MEYFGYVLDDVIECEACRRRAVDIHHISGRKMGAGKKSQKNHIENLVALCRECHIKAEHNKEFNQLIKEIHLKKL